MTRQQWAALIAAAAVFFLILAVGKSLVPNTFWWGVIIAVIADVIHRGVYWKLRG